MQAAFQSPAGLQSGRCHCGILARFSSHSETRLPVGFCRGVELKTHDSAEQKSRFEPGAPNRVESGATGWNSPIWWIVGESGNYPETGLEEINDPLVHLLEADFGTTSSESRVKNVTSG